MSYRNVAKGREKKRHFFEILSLQMIILSLSVSKWLLEIG